MDDTPQIATRRQREKQTISQMICLYCAHHHESDSRTHEAFCHEQLCPSCAKLESYAVLRTQKCRSMDTKTSCEECENHCYHPNEKAQIREIMRFSGPRMMTKHPLSAIRHLLRK